MFKLLVLPPFLLPALLALNCYDCDPSSEGRCLDTAESIKITHCESLSTEPKLHYTCIAFRLVPGPNSKLLKGVHRGCVYQRNDTLRPCYFVQHLVLGQVSDCESCNEDECNTTVLQDEEWEETEAEGYKNSRGDTSMPKSLTSILACFYLKWLLL